jgi:adenylate cyclase
MSNKRIVEYFKHRIQDKYLKEIKKKSDRMLGWFPEEESTAFFINLRNWIEFPKYYEPKELIEFHFQFVNMVVKTIVENEGTFIEFIGDEVVAVFGAPVKQANHASNACETALKIQLQFNALLNSYSKIKEILKLGIGINTGKFNCGFLGPDNFPKYTMMGDNVNLAARCEAACKHYDTWNIIANNTKELTEPKYEFRLIDQIKMLSEPKLLNIYELIGKK